MEKTYAEVFNANRVSWLYQIARSDVSPAAVKVGLLFATFVNPESREEVRPSYAWIMESSKLARATVARCLDELVNEGFLEIIRYAGFRSAYALPFTGDHEWKRQPIKI